MNCVIVIPAYNEEKTVGEVVRKCKMICPTQPPSISPNPPLLPLVRGRVQSGGEFSAFPPLEMGGQVGLYIIVVDDGSTDRTTEKAREAGAIVVCHPINRGLGAAISTGLEAALRLGADIIITLDADGQHDPAEVAALIQPIERGEADVVIGSRFLPVQGVKCKVRSDSSKCRVPVTRRLANGIGNIITAFLFGIHVTDSQSGFRAFSRQAAKCIKIRTNTMEVSSEIIREIKIHGLRLQEVPIKAIYTEYSLSKGQGFFKGVETLWKLVVLRFFR